ncbi:putative leucine-rich repeat receptor-like serine/threonine-protein kinase [Platanthera zijinensis]|uniref:Leucine-rich repeat receptor-like serine/threonine-protein kinase n=1 Tax=Platanthera zijinensis TaxID=2320716 RepID=A0AAP0GCT1_9ASPA
METRFCCFGALKPSARKNNSNEAIFGAGSQSQNSIQFFSYNELKSSTTNFHPTNKIGQGGFGSVYKGILRDGTLAAIKSLSTESKQGVHEFLTEIEMISNIRHPNLVELIGCCVEGSKRFLVYEYLENNSLASVLLSSNKKQDALDWPKRAAICLGIADGLAFLHEEVKPCIVHRDIKASNVLLDKDLLPRIGDFGLAKLFPDTITHISTRVAGTLGYLAPEYALLGNLTKKADVYSFGVLILEIISGRGNSRSIFGPEMKDLLDWTWQLWSEDRLLDIVDPELVEYSKHDVLRFIKVALCCTQQTSNHRPNMKKAAAMLRSDEIKLEIKALKQPSVIKERGHCHRIHGDNLMRPHLQEKTKSDITCTLIAPLSTFVIQPR